jgi:hypothetical protein
MDNYEVTDENERIKAEARITKEHQDKLAYAFGEVFRSPAGQFVLKDLRERCNADNCNVRNVAHPDTNSVMFECGKNAVYNYIMIYVRHDNERRKRTQR